MTRRSRRPWTDHDARLLVGWRVGAVYLLALDGVVAIAVPLIALATHHLPPAGASKGWLYDAAPGWPPFAPPSVLFWVGALGAVAFAVTFLRFASARLRTAWGIAIAVSWLFLAGFTAVVATFFTASATWPHDAVWSAAVIGLSAVATGVGSVLGRRHRATGRDTAGRTTASRGATSRTDRAS